MKLHVLMWIVWPSFLAAGVTSAIVFTLVDPHDVIFLGYLKASRQLTYASGFFLFWIMGALSSGLSLFLLNRSVTDY